MEFLRNTFFDYIFVVVTLFVSILYFVRYLYYTKLNKNKTIFNYIINKGFFIIKNSIYILGFICLLIAYLGPVFDLGVMDKSALNKDIIFVVDVSKSMGVKDIAYGELTRIDYVKKIITNFVTKNLGNNYSLYIFAGKSQNISPLTSDSNWFLNNMSTIGVNSVTNGGTKIKSAIDEILADNISNKKNTNIILFSDGGDEGENEDINILDIPNNIKIFSVGIGTEKGGYVTEGFDFFGNPKFKTYNGEYIVSKLTKSPLQNLANKGSGEFLIGDNQNILDKIKNKLLNSNGIKNNHGDVTYIFFVISFLLFLIGYLTNYKQKIGRN